LITCLLPRDMRSLLCSGLHGVLDLISEFRCRLRFGSQFQFQRLRAYCSCLFSRDDVDSWYRFTTYLCTDRYSYEHY